jgi:hypothetical protein
LQEIRAGEKEFLETIGNTGREEHVKRAMKCVKISMQRIMAMKGISEGSGLHSSEHDASLSTMKI